MSETPPLFGRILRAVCIILGVLLAFAIVTVPMDAEGQTILTLVGIGAFLVINRSKSKRAGLVLVVLSIVITTRYLFWRLTETLEFDSLWQVLLGTGLFLAECYAGLLLALSYMQTAYPLQRKPVPMPTDPASWPDIDVYVPSYNESLELVRPTVFAAMNIDWPRDKLNVWILDDGRRPEFREFAEQCGCGYIIRPDNLGAKAGNINHALKHTKGEFIAIFDCDHAPTRSFLQMTVGWLLRDARIALVQTPHHFYSPDPFERNLARKIQVPNEGLLFYGVIQQGNDLWNSAFFCGSCAVIRRSALMEVGGVPHQTVTEDCHCSFLMQQKGWHTAYLRVPLAAGLATERLALHIGQRARWARGMLQIMRQENTLFAPGLKWVQRLCYFMAGFSFLFSLPRIVFLTSPLVYLFLGESIIAASPLSIIAYAGSHMFHAIATTARMNGRNRHSFWSEIYEASLCASLLPITIATLWDPRKGKFNVTDKGGTLDEGYLDLRAVTPSLILLGLLSVGFMIGLWGTFSNPVGSLTFQAYLLNTIWAGMALIPVSASIAVGREREQGRNRARAPAEIPAELIQADGARVAAVTIDISLSGARLTIARPLGIADGDTLRVAFSSFGEVIELRAKVLHWEGDQAFLIFHIDTLAEEGAVSRLFFGRPDAWLHWDHWPQDRPLKALAEVVRATAAAVFVNYRFGVVKKKAGAAKAPAKVAPQRVSDVVMPKRPANTSAKPRVAAALALALLAAPATAQVPGQAPSPTPIPFAIPAERPAVPAPPSPAAQPLAPGQPFAPGQPLPPGAREARLLLRDLGLRSPMQLRGISDLQGVLFGLRADEVVTAGRLSVMGGASPSLIASLSQIAITLNEQSVGVIPLDPARQTFGPVGFDLDPLFFAEINRLNFRFAGRYALECNDPLSGLLWATISDLSTLSLRIERLPPVRDLARLPEPLFDRRVLQGALNLPVILPETTGPAGLRAAAIVASWFAVQADYRGATFPVERAVPAQGNAVVIAVGPDAVPGLSLPRIEGPTLAILPSPTDPFGSLLVIAGRTEQEAAAAASALAAGRAGLSGAIARVAAPTLPVAQPYAAPRWLRTDGPVPFGQMVDRSELQASGFSSGTIRIPARTAPDLYTWRNHGLPVHLVWRSPPGPVADVATSRLDVGISNTYLRSFTLGEPALWWPLQWAIDRTIGGFETHEGRVTVPPYLLLGRDELQFRFDMRPMARGDCTAVPADVRAAIDPESTFDISGAHRYARMPNLGFFASSGFPFTKYADLSGTAAVLPERPNTIETGAFLDLIGQLAIEVGAPATGLQVVHPGGLNGVAGRDLLVVGTLGRQPALAGLMQNSPVRVEGDRLTLALPDALQRVRTLFLDAPTMEERVRATTALGDVGDGMGALLGMESPLQAGRSIVAVTGVTPAAVAAMVAALRDPVQGPLIQGDVALLTGGTVSSYRTAATYGVGELPPWLMAQVWLGGHPWRTALVLLASAALIGIPFFWMLRRRTATRLRARTPKGH
ncbi:UDP-forming cellulose synthase catalytic subunit [Humitalea rosea]|uniref:UDP-forming cellulose synthase catalytic subunit n=1 Tax=Humitalea rosea TaxID=990373 RepID=UPI001314ED99|nr:UDP-forming cellulose synthase catalytic subunit [Humitalea rosea]